MSVAMESRSPQQQSRPRSKSNFSFKSNNSHASDPNKTSESGHARKVSDSYKPHLNTTGKADPNAAMTEVQPSMSHLLLAIFVVASLTTAHSRRRA